MVLLEEIYSRQHPVSPPVIAITEFLHLRPYEFGDTFLPS